MNVLRRAQPSDIAAIQALILRSARELSSPYYTPQQTEAMIHHVFGVDSQLIAEATYFVIENEAGLLACGGWRAFFVDPSWARRGLGRRLMAECVCGAQDAGFSALELVSTLPGEPLYLATGFAVIERFDLHLAENLPVPVSLMCRAI